MVKVIFQFPCYLLPRIDNSLSVLYVIKIERSLFVVVGGVENGKVEKYLAYNIRYLFVYSTLAVYNLPAYIIDKGLY